MYSMRTCICTCAHFGSGQDELARILKKHYPVFEIYGSGAIFKKIALDKGLKSTRENLENIRIEYDKEHGDREYFPKDVLENIVSGNVGIPIITGLRTKEELKVFKESFDNVYLIDVYADKMTRFNRIKKRGAERDSKEFDDFKKRQESEARMFDISYLKSQADFHFNCSMTLDDFEKNAEHYLKQFTFLDGLL